jgi:DNA polymerase-3 subunit alpha
MSTTTPSEFVHLHVHSQYSLLDGAIRLTDLLRRTAEFGMNAVALTDHGTMFGTIEFYEKAVAAGIKPIIGCECYVAPRRLTDKTPRDHKGLTHLILLAENMTGYRNLCRLMTVAQIKGFYYKPRVDKQILASHHDGLIALSACLHGEIPSLIRRNRQTEADEAARQYQKLFGEGNFFLEIQNNGIDIQDAVNQGLADMSQRLSIPLVASNDCHYLDQKDVRAHDVLLCIQTGKTVDDTERLKFRTDQLYFKPPREMADFFSDYPGAIENTARIAERCNLGFDFTSYHFPKFEAPEQQNEAAYFEQCVRAGFDRVIEKIRARKPDTDLAPYSERLEYEIGVIKEMGFAGYFLIVADFIRYARENQIPVGPGRGSAAGSLVAYSLGITGLDPLEYGLIFERFLNPARKSMPDIDVDFCINGREDVFKYVVAKYGGGDYVAQIITYGKLKTRAVIRDVGRALNIPLRDVDAIAKMVPDKLGINLEEALQEEPRLAQMAAERTDVADLIDVCRVLEGLPRHASTHAAGVVISDRPLVDYLPLYRGKRGEVVTQYDMKIVEKIGLVKFDFLGLRNLTVIANTLALIKRQGKTPPDLGTLDLDDPDTYRLLCAGDTTGVFQLESTGMKDLLVRLKPECFNDIIALVALYRPGPMESGMIDDYVDCKHGRKPVSYLLPQLAPILEETYGVIVYQEQVMKIAAALARYTMAEADDLRKAMGKKIKELLARHRRRFIEGAVAQGIDGRKAQTIFELIDKFGGYGFNKSHSAAYALIAYQTAYLKAHFPVEFMASLLTSEMHSTDGVVKFIAECRNHNISVLPPDIYESDKHFTVKGEAIRFGLVAVKNVGEGAIEAIVAARNAHRFTSLFDFCEHVDLKKVNKRVIESLIKCGALDATGARRSQMMAALEAALEYGQRMQKERNDPQLGLFDTGEHKPAINPPELPKIQEWEDRERLACEKEALGFYVSGHPLKNYEAVLEKFTTVNAITVKEGADGETVRVGGIVSAVKIIKTRKGDKMAFVTIEDMQGSVEAVVFSVPYARSADLLVEDNPVLVQGRLQKDEQSIKVIAETVIAMNRAEDTWTASIHFHLDMSRTDREMLERLQETFRQHPGTCRAFLHLRGPQGTDTLIGLPETMRLRAGAILTREVNRMLGYKAVETVCSTTTLAARGGNGGESNGSWRHKTNG